MMTTFPLTSRPACRKRLSALCDWRWAFAAVIVLTFVVRLYNLGHSSLVHGEAGRANFAWSATLEQARWFPPLHYALLWAVRHTLGGSEFVLRLPSALAGIACVVTLFFFTRRYLDSWSGVCVAAVAACHAELIVFSRMLKEFSIEALVTVVVTWAGVEAYRSMTRRSLRVFVLCSLMALGLTYTGSLVVCAWIAVLFWSWLTTSSERRWSLKQLCVALFVLALAGGLWYWWLSGAVNRAQTVYHYGTNRGAWPVDFHFVTLISWFFVQSYGALRYVLGITSLYAPIDTLIGGYELLLIAAAWFSLRNRLPSVCAATGVLWVVTVAAGAMGMWPYGSYHTMVFMVPLLCLAVGCGMRHMALRLGPALPSAFLVLVCLLNPAARAVKNTVLYPQVLEHLRPVLEYVDRQARPEDGIFAYYAAGAAVQHYWKRADVETLLEPTDDRGNIEAFVDRFDRFMRDHERVWFIFTHDWGNERETWVAHLKERFRLADKIEVADASAHLFESAREARADRRSALP